jgi:hypothetical protein
VITVEPFDLVARADDDVDPTLVIPLLVSIWTWVPPCCEILIGLCRCPSGALGYGPGYG